MSHHVPWCGCDPTHLPMHSRGRVEGCEFNNDPKEMLVRDTEQFLMLHSDLQKLSAAKELLQKWMKLDG